MTLRFILASTLCLAALSASAQMYRWTDDKGRVHITDTPPPASAKGVQKIGGASKAATPSSQTPYELAQAMKDFPVTLYTSPTCTTPCASARTVLNQRGVPFREVQVWDDATNAELKQVSGSNEVPTLRVGRSVHVGFQHAAYDALLDSARYPKAGRVAARAQAAPPPPDGYSAPGEPPVAEPVKPEAEAPATGPYAPRAPRAAQQ